MKNSLLSLIFALLFGVSLSAFEPLTTWPYIYENFIPGRIKTYQGTDIEYDKLNINVISCKAHYVDNGVIMEADANSIALLVMGGDSYVCIGGRMVKVLRNASHGAVALSRSVDVDTMNKADIGYGKSSLASTQNVSVSALSTEMDFSINKSLDEVDRSKESGDRLAMKDIVGICYKGQFIPASRTDILGIPGIDKDKVKQFLKNEKIKFKNIDDLAKLLDFLYSL